MEAIFRFNIFLYLVIVFSAVFHEYAHAWVANYLGDSTAKYAGRLTLNPLKHVDLIGTVILPLMLLFFAGGFIGWAKPVPYNPYNLKDQKYGTAKVAMAGPAANLLIALVFGLFIRFAPLAGSLHIAFSWILFVNIFLALFNLIPIPPLDGSKLLMTFFPRAKIIRVLERSFIGVFIAIAVAIIFLSPLSYVVYYFFAGNTFPGLIF